MLILPWFQSSNVILISPKIPAQIEFAKNWHPLNLRSRWKWFILRLAWATWSRFANVSPFEDWSSPCRIWRCGFDTSEQILCFPRDAISVDIREYLRVSHNISEWFTLLAITLPCSWGKYISDNLWRIGCSASSFASFIFPGNTSMKLQREYLPWLTIFAMLHIKDKAWGRRRTSDVE